MISLWFSPRRWICRKTLDVEEAGHKNLISNRLIELRKKRGLSQRALAYQLQLIGVDVDKNVITRLETGKRHVTDIELRALCRVLHVNYEDLIEEQQ